MGPVGEAEWADHLADGCWVGAGCVFEIHAPPGSGKSRCVGAVLKVWQDTLPVPAQKQREKGVLIPPLAVLATGKAALRPQLRESVMAFVEDNLPYGVKQ